MYVYAFRLFVKSYFAVLFICSNAPFPNSIEMLRANAPQINLDAASQKSGKSNRSNRSKRKPQLQPKQGGQRNSRLSKSSLRPQRNSGERRSGSSNKASILSFKRITGELTDWPDKNLDDAPEVALISKISPKGRGSRYATTILSKLLNCIQIVCKNRVQDYNNALAHTKPIEARTLETLEYVHQLALYYKPTGNLGVPMPMQKPTRSGKKLSDFSVGSDNMSVASSIASEADLSRRSKRKAELLGLFYDKAYQTLKKLENCIETYRHMIFALTFTRYSEKVLTESEQKLTRGKSIIGSYFWIVVFALEQLQDDPELELVQHSSKNHPGLQDLTVEILFVLNLCFQTWNEMVLAFAGLEHIHKKTEDIFHRQTITFQNIAAPDPDTANKAAIHSKKYRRNENELDDLKGGKFDPYATLMTWKKTGLLPARILYKTNYTRVEELWRGFDPLNHSKKITMLKELLSHIKRILEDVKHGAQSILRDLLKPAPIIKQKGNLNKPDHHNRGFRGSNQPLQFGEIGSYEEGIDAMDEILAKKLLGYEWSPEEVSELLETDKIFLDDIDLLTLGAGVTRNLLNEAKHQIHVDYETCRLLDFKEFSQLPTYDKVYVKVKEDFKENPYNLLLLQGSHSAKKFKKASLAGTPFDIEEGNTELRNVSGLFRTSPYHDIIANLPVYTNQFGFTLQEAEMVFTPSSEKLLSSTRNFDSD